MPRTPPAPEPDYRTASSWWNDLPNIWTPIGWKDHLCRFNILWNGTILAKPDMNRRTKHLAGQGLQLTITPRYNEDHLQLRPMERRLAPPRRRHGQPGLA